MTIASELLHRHFQTLVADHAQWQTLIADDLVWELPYAPTLGHPARLSGREEVMRFVTWFLGVVDAFRFFDLQVYACADPDAAVAEVKAEGLIKPTGRRYRQEYVVFLRATRGNGPVTRVVTLWPDWRLNLHILTSGGFQCAGETLHHVMRWNHP